MPLLVETILIFLIAFGAGLGVGALIWRR